MRHRLSWDRAPARLLSRRDRAAAAIPVILAALVLALAAAPRPARSEEPASTAARTIDKTADCRRSAFRVVLDVGHTIDSPGADSARGVPEYQFNLALADATKDALVKAGFDDTVRMITTTRHVAGGTPSRSAAARACSQRSCLP